MIKGLLTGILFSSTTLLFGQLDSINYAIDTLTTADDQTQLIYKMAIGDDGAKDIKVISILKQQQIIPIVDTTILLSKNDLNASYYQKKNGLDIF